MSKENDKLASILLDMVRSALAWEERNEASSDNISVDSVTEMDKDTLETRYSGKLSNQEGRED